MRKTRNIVRAGVAFAMVAALGTGIVAMDTASAKMKPPFGTKADVAYSQDLWAALVKARLVGKNAINTRPYEGQAPHGAVLQTIDTSVVVRGKRGRVVVKKNFGPKGVSITDVWTNPNKHLKAVTVMFKRKGYDRDNQDWFWVKYKPNGKLHTNPKGMMLAGRVAKGKDKGCIACHKGAGGGDYLFINDK